MVGTDTSRVESNETSAELSPLAPVGEGERVELLDILRGVAIFGILLVNLQMFFSPIYLWFSTADWWTAPVDKAAERLVLFVAQGKFYTLFSFLFGVGMSIQLQRATRRGDRFVPFFARRMVWLLLIGLAHAFLLWFGDILATYATVGFALILFRNRRPTTLAVWAIILLLIPLVLVGAATAIVEVASMFPEPAAEIERATAESDARSVEAAKQAREGYPTGSYVEILPLRARQVGAIYTMFPLFASGVLALFLIGLNLGRRRFLQEVEPNLTLIRRLIWWLLGVGVAGNAVGVVLLDRVHPGMPSVEGFVQQVAFAVGAPALTFFYIAAITLMVQKPSWRRRLAPLGAVGRMALSNYLLHSLVFTTLANGYGLGLYGRIRPSVGLLMTLAMFAAQVPLSVWWLRRFRFGPVEWLWRSLSYWRLQPMRRAA
jgi:uncharacterized protein